MWSARGNAAANKSLDGTATIKPFLEVSWHVIVDSFGGSHGVNPPPADTDKVACQVRDLPIREFTP